MNFCNHGHCVFAVIWIPSSIAIKLTYSFSTIYFHFLQHVCATRKIHFHSWSNQPPCEGRPSSSAAPTPSFPCCRNQRTEVWFISRYTDPARVFKSSFLHRCFIVQALPRRILLRLYRSPAKCSFSITLLVPMHDLCVLIFSSEIAFECVHLLIHGWQILSLIGPLDISACWALQYPEARNGKPFYIQADND